MCSVSRFSQLPLWGAVATGLASSGMSRKAKEFRFSPVQGRPRFQAARGFHRISEPGSAFGYDLHHDYAYWADLGATADEFTTLFVALDPSDAASGAVARSS